jgi:hypothetical protein
MAREYHLINHGSVSIRIMVRISAFFLLDRISISIKFLKGLTYIVPVGYGDCIVTVNIYQEED